MKYLLDTNICIYIMKQKPPEVLARFKSSKMSEIGLSSITVAELEYGVFKSQQQSKNRDVLTQFLRPFQIIDFNEDAAAIYGSIRSSLEQKGEVIGAMDMLIAAHAISIDATLITNNLREFERVSTLALENWVA